MAKYQYTIQGVDYDVEINEVEGSLAKVNVNGIDVVGTRNVEEAPIKKGEEVNVFIHRAFTYGADGIVNIVENANKFEDWMVI